MLYNFQFEGFPKFRHLAILAISGGYFGYFGFLTPAGFFSPYPGNNLHTHRYKIQRVLVFALAPNVHFYLCLGVSCEIRDFFFADAWLFVYLLLLVFAWMVIHPIRHSELPKHFEMPLLHCLLCCDRDGNHEEESESRGKMVWGVPLCLLLLSPDS